MRPRKAFALLLVAALPAAAAPPASAGVKFGDAVPAIIKASDLDRIRQALSLKRFSVLAAVRLGAAEGREALLVEPLPGSVLSRVKEGCDHGGFCPDPTGFVASRLRVVRILGDGVEVLLTVGGEARGAHGRLFDPRDLGMQGRFLGWTGHAEAAAGHVAMVLTPLSERDAGAVGTGAEPPFIVQWNAIPGRFQLYDCEIDEDEETICGFREELAD